MYFVIHSNIYGAKKPVAFQNKTDAEFFKRSNIVVEAVRSGYYDKYSDSHGDHHAAVLSKFAIKLMRQLESKIYKFPQMTEEEKIVYGEFVSILEKSDNVSFTESGDFITFSDDTYVCYQIFEMPEVIPAGVQTDAGEATVHYYDDGCANGVQIQLDGNIVCALDVYRSSEGESVGEARVLVYKKVYPEDEEEAPIECVSINR